ncbi:MAG: citrate/2-methylcitrate synthase [Actinomycetota bacterium]
MTTYVRAPEAARRLDVTLNTLYAYVSRGRISRTTAADGRTSLFDLDEVAALRERSRRKPPELPPSIDVRIATGVTNLDEAGVRYRGHRVVDLIDERFEVVAELLWSGQLPDPDHPPAPWPTIPAGTLPAEPPSIAALVRLALAVDGHVGCSARPDDPVAVGRLVLGSVPDALGTGVDSASAPFAERLAGCWQPRPHRAFVDAINAVLILLADHELATSTLAVRVATSTRSSTAMSVVAGLAAVSGSLHGGAAAEAHDLIDRSMRLGPRQVLGDLLDRGERVPGFGHSIYRNVDPRFELLFERVREIPGAHAVVDTVDALVAGSSITIARAPNVDLALGALLAAAHLPADTPLFAIARIAGWIAHHAEELDERPIRYRGLAR